MPYCIGNHTLKCRVHYSNEWTIVGNGYICIRSGFAPKEEIKICKNPEGDSDCKVEKVCNKLGEIISKIETAPKMEKKLFTHDTETMDDDSIFEWRIQVGKDKIYSFDAKQVGWVLCRLRGRLKWNLVPWLNGQGILVFTNALESKDVYAMVTCHYSSEHEKIMKAAGHS